MISRRTLLARLPLVAAGGLGLWLLRDRLPGSGPDLTFAQNRTSGWIPLESRDGLIVISGRVAGETIRMVVDSGAEFSAIDAALAARLRLNEGASLPIVAYGVGGQATLARTLRFDMQLPGLTVRPVRAAALDLAALSRATGRDFAMLLGRDVLGQVVLDADLPARRIAFHAAHGWTPARDAQVTELRMTRGGPTLTVTIDGVPVEVMVDTGATGVLALSEPAARAAGLLAPGRDVRRAPSVSLGGLSMDRLVTAARLELGGLTIRNAPVQIYATTGSGPMPGGLLGIGFLRRFRAALDLPGRRLALQRPGLQVVGPPV